MAVTPDNDGYWLVSQDGTVYVFGDASNYGSVQGASAPATSLAATPSGGYWVLTADGAVHPFGDASNFGSPATGPVAPLSLPNGPPSQPPGSDGSGIAGGSVSGGSNSECRSASSPRRASGTAGGGDTIEISGSGFTGATAVDFGRNASSDFTVTSATTITAVAPVGTGTVSVEVVTPAGTSGPSSAAQFTYIPTGQPPISAHGQSLEIGGVPTLFTGFNADPAGHRLGDQRRLRRHGHHGPDRRVLWLTSALFARKVLGLPGNDGDEHPHGSAGLVPPSTTCFTKRPNTTST